jgi:hypothetical protein
MVTFSPDQYRLIQLGIRYGAYVKDSGTEQQLYAARDLGRQIEARLLAVGGDTGWTLEQLERAETPVTVPESATIGFDNVTDKSVLVFWNPHSDGGSVITGYHLVIKNEDTGQTITESTTSANVTNTFLQNLDSATNYKAYVIVINAIGNSFEQSNSFKTLGVKVEPEPEPIIISPQVQAILTKFDNNDYEYPYTDLPALISYVKNGTLSNENFLITINNLLESQTIIDKTIVITYCVNVYTLDSGGNVLSDHYDKINLSSLQNLLSENKYVFYCKDGIIPTEQQVRDFYGYTASVADSSINSMMVSQSVGAFILKDGRLKGEILYIANDSFNSFYYGKSITSLVQIKSKSGIPIAVKPNNLNFTNTQRDERIQIDEAVGNFKELIVDFFVWKSTTDLRQFSANKQIEIVEELPPPEEPDFKPCPIGYHKDFSGKCVPDDPLPEIPRDKLIDTLKGFLFGTVALSLLARKY